MHSCFTISHYNENKSKNNYFSLRTEGLQCIKQYGTMSANIQKNLLPHPFFSLFWYSTGQFSDSFRFSYLSVSSQSTALVKATIVLCSGGYAALIFAFNTANTSCKVFPRSRPVDTSAFESFVMVMPSAVKVTAIINTIGIQSMQP